MLHTGCCLSPEWNLKSWGLFRKFYDLFYCRYENFCVGFKTKCAFAQFNNSFQFTTSDTDKAVSSLLLHFCHSLVACELLKATP